MRRKTIVTVAAGAALTFGVSCGKKDAEPVRNPPPPEPAPAPAAADPPAAPPADAIPEVADDPAPAPSGLPTWDEVPSGHPAGATNPPIPELIVTPDGRCTKNWVGGMIANRRLGDRVEDCGDDCAGTPIQCPPRAEKLLDAWRSDQGE